MSSLSYRRPIAMINYHNTPFARREEFARQMAWCAQRFSPVDADVLEDFYRTGTWRTSKPGVVIAFFNGYRNNFDVALPILERYGLTGWFCVATDFCDLPSERQAAFGASHTFDCMTEEYVDDRVALSWDEMRTLRAHGHEIASHTASHSEVIRPGTDPAIMRREIVHSAERIREQVGVPPAAFSWLRGEAHGSCPDAAPYLQEAGYRFLIGSRYCEYLGGARE